MREGEGASGLGRALAFLVDQDGLSPSARRLVSAVDAARPAAGAALALPQFLYGPPDASLARRRLFGVIDPADKLVATQRGEVSPQFENLVVCFQGVLKIGGRLMHGSLRKTVWHGASCSSRPIGRPLVNIRGKPIATARSGRVPGET